METKEKPISGLCVAGKHGSCNGGPLYPRYGGEPAERRFCACSCHRPKT